jgi:alcohol dehydrogenase class IV
VLFGPGLSATALTDEIDRLGGRRVMVIATPREHARQAAVLTPFAGRIVASFTDVLPHVPIATAQAARATAEDARVDLLLAIGGGSTIGAAKAIALTTGLPIIALPTTYAGSEVTPVWGLTRDNHKQTGVDHRVLPRTVVYDPDLTRTLPLGESMASGVNALAHAVDAFWAPHFNRDVAIRASAAIRALVGGLDALHRAEPADVAATAYAREETMRGAMLAGLVFAQAGSGLHHKICHVLGGRYNLPHAQTHAVMLPHVLAFNAPADTTADAEIGSALGGDPSRATQSLVELVNRWGVPRRLSDLGFDLTQAPEAADEILPSVPASNPRPVMHVDLIAMLTAAYNGVVTGETL